MAVRTRSGRRSGATPSTEVQPPYEGRSTYSSPSSTSRCSITGNDEESTPRHNNRAGARLPRAGARGRLGGASLTRREARRSTTNPNGHARELGQAAKHEGNTPQIRRRLRHRDLRRGCFWGVELRFQRVRRHRDGQLRPGHKGRADLQGSLGPRATRKPSSHLRPRRRVLRGLLEIYCNGWARRDAPTPSHHRGRSYLASRCRTNSSPPRRLAQSARRFAKPIATEVERQSRFGRPASITASLRRRPVRQEKGDGHPATRPLPLLPAAAAAVKAASVPPPAGHSPPRALAPFQISLKSLSVATSVTASQALAPASPACSRRRGARPRTRARTQLAAAGCRRSTNSGAAAVDAAAGASSSTNRARPSTARRGASAALEARRRRTPYSSQHRADHPPAPDPRSANAASAGASWSSPSMSKTVRAPPATTSPRHCRTRPRCRRSRPPPPASRGGRPGRARRARRRRRWPRGAISAGVPVPAAPPGLRHEPGRRERGDGDRRVMASTRIVFPTIGLTAVTCGVLAASAAHGTVSATRVRARPQFSKVWL